MRGMLLVAILCAAVAAASPAPRAWTPPDSTALAPRRTGGPPLVWPTMVARLCKPAGALVAAHVTVEGRADSVRVLFGFPRAECLDSTLAATADSAALAWARASDYAPARVRGVPASGWTMVPCLLPPAPDTAAVVFGCVLDRASGRPIQYANVVVIGTRLGAQTGARGEFVVAVRPGRVILDASGFCAERATGTVEVAPGGADTLVFRLARQTPCAGAAR